MGLTDNPLMPAFVGLTLLGGFGTFMDVTFTLNNFGGINLVPLAGLVMFASLVMSFLISNVEMGMMEIWEFMAFWIPVVGAGLIAFDVTFFVSLYNEIMPFSGIGMMVLLIVGVYAVMD